ncbi:MAG: hypothetical protein D8M59_15470 [Planctomycetes bacterium]|nr:hypothetical protein [Planctomycetota bacterium]
MSSGAKWAIGCGLAAVVAIVLVCGGVLWIGYAGWNRTVGKYTAMGYELVMQEAVTITTQLDKDTVYLTQAFSLEATSNGNIAVLGETADIHATVNGDVHFFGDTITIHPDAVITGELEVFCKRLVLQGQVLGPITGEYAEKVDERTAETDQTPAETPPSDNSSGDRGDAGDGGGG